MKNTFVFFNKLKKKLLFFTAAVLFLLGSHCARQAMPPGGPEDRTPPRVVATIPENGRTHASRSPKITIEFSEPIEHESVPQALFLAPRPSEFPKLKWKGKRLAILFPDSLLPNQTYLISLGTGIRDRHGNPLKQTVTLAFSTSSRLDNGHIWGQVFGKESLLNVQVWGYLLRLLPRPDPRKDQPQYVTQCGADGKFSFGFLSPGTYRLFALIDRDKNGRYTPGSDVIGFPPRDARVTPRDSTDGPLFFRIAVQDTLPPKVLSAFATDNRHLTLRFSEPVDSLDASQPAHFSVSSEKETLDVTCAYRSFINPSRVILCTGKQDSAQTYTLKMHEIHDLAGWPLDSASTEVQVKGSSLPDTLPPKMVEVFPRDSSHQVLPDVRLSCVFSEAMDTARAGLILVSVSGDSLGGRFFWSQPDRLVFQPKNRLPDNGRFVWKVLPPGLFDRQGNAFVGDSVLTTFRVVPWDTLTEISGQVIDLDSTAQGLVVVWVQEISPPKIKKKVVLPRTGAFCFSDLFPGEYRLFAFRDSDRDGRLSPGSLDPFRFAERFLFYPDTIAARSRWPNEGNDLTLPK